MEQCDFRIYYTKSNQTEIHMYDNLIICQLQSHFSNSKKEKIIYVNKDFMKQFFVS